MSKVIYEPCLCGSGKKYKFCCYDEVSKVSSESLDKMLKKIPMIPVSSCLINEDWSQGEKGLCTIIISRAVTSSKCIMGMYMVDLFCLGVKDTFLEMSTKGKLQYIISEAEQAHNCGFVEIPYETARSIILGAIQYASNLGFEPNEDWEGSHYIVEKDSPYSCDVEFGYKGKPFYTQGPKDDVEKICKVLEPLVRAGEAEIELMPRF